MINYGIVYPQAILVFVITLLYSVIQPLILVFGALYFGVAYVVYKYKLLFGASVMVTHDLPFLTCRDRSVLQTVRISRTSMAYHLRSADLGGHNLHRVHERHVHREEVVRSCDAARTSACGHTALVVLHRQAVPPTEQVRELELRA